MIEELSLPQALVDIHTDGDGMAGGFLTTDETSVIQGALDLTSLTAHHSMTPLNKVSGLCLPLPRAVFEQCINLDALFKTVELNLVSFVLSAMLIVVV